MPLNDTERFIVHCVRMRFTEQQSLAYLKANSIDISRTWFYRIKGRLEAQKLSRLYEVAKIGFVDQHLERIDQLEIIQQEMWKLYHLEQGPFKKACILEKIANVQPYLSAYYEATKMVVETNAATNKPEPRQQEPETVDVSAIEQTEYAK